MKAEVLYEGNTDYLEQFMIKFYFDNCQFPRLIKHTEKLLEEKEEKLCVKVLRTLREMMAIDTDYGEKVNVIKKKKKNPY